MNKFWLIVQREFLTRVKNKTFILATLLTPLGFGLITLLGIYLSSESMKSTKTVAVYDPSKLVDMNDLNQEHTTIDFKQAMESLDALRDRHPELGYDMVVVIPDTMDTAQREFKLDFFSKEKQSISTITRVENNLVDAIKEYKVRRSGIDKTTYERIKTRVTLENALRDADGSQGDTSSRSSIAVATGLSYFMGFLMYIVIFIYGGQIMRGVMEEKISRIVEVMISTVKPFDLMLGKIFGVGLVGLLQLAIWIVLIPLVLYGINMVFGSAAPSAGSQEVMAELQRSGQGDMIQKIIYEMGQINWYMIIPVFVIFFFGGYFLYSALIAAVGSAVGDDLGEGQQMMMPVMLPVIFSMIMIPSVFNDPDGIVAVVGSIFPLSSPIIMPARLPFDPPWWQIIVSIVVLIASVILFTWIAGRIYRVGILLYGKKVGFKEMAKWIFRK